MAVDLSPELERLLTEKVRSGRYSSTSDVVREALRLLDERDRAAALRRDTIEDLIAEGAASLRRGEGVDGEEVFTRLLAELNTGGDRDTG
jgi:antitoxin ParD1/3/4